MGKSVLVSGANKGIGYEICRQLGQKGWQVFLGARNEERGKAAVAKLMDQGVKATHVLMDTSDPDSISKAAKDIARHTSSLDVLINNAAILLGEGSSLLDVSVEESLASLKTNSLGPLWVVQAFGSFLEKGSRIVNISSGAGQFCGGVSNYAPIYGLSKTTLNAITLHLKRDLQGKGILINAMCPGWVKTDMGGSGANRSVSQGAETAVWLATDAPNHINGKFLRDKKEIPW